MKDAQEKEKEREKEFVPILSMPFIVETIQRAFE